MNRRGVEAHTPRSDGLWDQETMAGRGLRKRCCHKTWTRTTGDEHTISNCKEKQGATCVQKTLRGTANGTCPALSKGKSNSNQEALTLQQQVGIIK
jgi:hypothetical protein